MSHEASADHERRSFLYIATAGFGAVGAGLAAVPFVHQMNPDATTLAAATIEVDIGSIEVGQSVTVLWRSKPVFIRRRTPEEIELARAVDLAELKDPQTDADRVIEGKEEWLIIIGICTHLNCIPTNFSGDYGGWLCNCHGSHYDTAGRIRKGPAPYNMAVPPITFLSDTLVQLG